jgi:hypothetical protein
MTELRPPHTRGIFWQALLLTALIAGTLDASGAIISYTLRGNHQPARIFRFIASGIFGPQATAGGTDMVVYGVLLHYFIAFCFTAAFFTVYPRLPFLRRQPVLTAIGYGLFVWLIMNEIVLPLSRTRHLPFTWSGALIGAGILIIAIGLPVSFLARAWLRPLYLNQLLPNTI